MPILNKIFYKAYNNIANNKKALAVRGWYPPSMKLLDHPSLSSETQTATQTPASSSNINAMPALPVLNTGEGYAATVLDRLLRARGQSEGANKAAEQRKLTIEAVVENIAKSQ